MKKIFLKKRKNNLKVKRHKNKKKNKYIKAKKEKLKQKTNIFDNQIKNVNLLPANENMLDNYNFIQYNNIKFPRIHFGNIYNINIEELYKKINLDKTLSTNYINNIPINPENQLNPILKKYPNPINPLIPNNPIENKFEKTEIIIDIKNTEIEDKPELNFNILNNTNDDNSNHSVINNDLKIELKQKKFKKKNIFKLYDKNENLICKKRGKKSLTKRKSHMHTSEDEDNILRKIQVHFLTFLISFTNDYLDTIYLNFKKRDIPHFRDIDYKIKREISHKSIEKMKISTIGEILQKRASPKNKSCDNNKINNVIYNNVCEQCPKLKEIYFNKLFKEFFIEYYYNNKNEKYILINGKTVNLSPRTRTFNQLILKNINCSEKFKNIASYFYMNINNEEKNEDNKDKKGINKIEINKKPLFIIDN